jgi:antitoxin component YwqK of YwqJK toxin-antitoxin module
MLRLWFAYIIFLCLCAACSGSPKDQSSDLLADKVNTINRFVPEYLASIPKISLPNKEYRQHHYNDFVVSGYVDALNLKQGYWKILDTSEDFNYQGAYVNDMLDGWWEVFSKNTLICAGNYEQNKKQGYWGYLQLGYKKTSKYVNYKNDSLSGLAQEFSSDSILLSIGNYENGLRNGYWKIYSDIGLLKEEGDYYEDYKSGWWKNYDDTGQIIQEASYSRDEIAGYVIKYVNGIKAEEGQQFNGKKRGVWKYYDIDGNALKIEEFDDN